MTRRYSKSHQRQRFLLEKQLFSTWDISTKFSIEVNIIVNFMNQCIIDNLCHDCCSSVQNATRIILRRRKVSIWSLQFQYFLDGSLNVHRKRERDIAFQVKLSVDSVIFEIDILKAFMIFCCRLQETGRSVGKQAIFVKRAWIRIKQQSRRLKQQFFGIFSDTRKNLFAHMKINSIAFPVWYSAKIAAANSH